MPKKSILIRSKMSVFAFFLHIYLIDKNSARSNHEVVHDHMILVPNHFMFKNRFWHNFLKIIMKHKGERENKITQNQ